MFDVYARQLHTKSLTELFGCVEELSDGVRIMTGNKYGDGSDVVIRITDNENLIMFSDEGRTYDYLNKVFELGEEDVMRNIASIFKEHCIVSKAKIIELEIELGDESIEPQKFEFCIALGIEQMLSCIGFLEAMKLFYV